MRLQHLWILLFGGPEASFPKDTSRDCASHYLNIVEMLYFIVGEIASSTHICIRHVCIFRFSRLVRERCEYRIHSSSCIYTWEKNSTHVEVQGQLSGGRCLKDILYHPGGKVGAWGYTWLSWETLVFQVGGRSSMCYSCCFDSPIFIT